MIDTNYFALYPMVKVKINYGTKAYYLKLLKYFTEPYCIKLGVDFDLKFISISTSNIYQKLYFITYNL